MKMLIDIPKEMYQDVIEDKDNIKTWAYKRVIKNGTPILEEVTNGDIIKSIFPNMRVGKLHDCIFAKDYKNVWFGEEWWNTPYMEDNK